MFAGGSTSPDLLREGESVAGSRRLPLTLDNLRATSQGSKSFCGVVGSSQ